MVLYYLMKNIFHREKQANFEHNHYKQSLFRVQMSIRAFFLFAAVFAVGSRKILPEHMFCSSTVFGVLYYY